MLTVLLDEFHDPVDLNATETTCPFENDRIEPKLRNLVFPFDVDVRWFAPIQRHKEKSVCVNPQNSGHSEDILSHQFANNVAVVRIR